MSSNQCWSIRVKAAGGKQGRGAWSRRTRGFAPALIASRLFVRHASTHTCEGAPTVSLRCCFLRSSFASAHTHDESTVQRSGAALELAQSQPKHLRLSCPTQPTQTHAPPCILDKCGMPFGCIPSLSHWSWEGSGRCLTNETRYRNSDPWRPTWTSESHFM